jgi:hypothetical protein
MNTGCWLSAAQKYRKETNMPRKSKIDELREKFEVALNKGLESESAVERTAAIKATADMLNPNLTDLQKQVKQAEDAREASDSALKTAQTALDAANVRIAELQPLVAQVIELTTFKAGIDEWKAEQVRALTEEATQKLWTAQRAEHAAIEKLREADNKIANSGWKELRATLADLIARHAVPMPDFWETPATMPSAFWTLWGWSETKAKVYTAFKIGYTEPSPAWRQQLLRHLKATLPLQQFAGAEPPAPIESLSEKLDCLTEMAKRWNVWPEIAREFEQAQVERQAEYLREHYAMMQAQSNDAALRGEGRTPIVPEEPVSSVPLSEHVLGCQCGVCSPGLKRRSSLDVVEETF